MKTSSYFSTLLITISAVSSGYGQWNEIIDFPESTDGSFAVIVDGTPYINGGLSSNSFYAYDEIGDLWTPAADVPSMGSHKAWAFAFAVNGKGYVAGGSYETAGDLEKTLWEYDPASDSWTQRADFPGGERDGGYAFSIGGKGYMGGGFDGQFTHYDLYEYDPASNTWNQKSDYPGGNVIFPASFVIEDKAYVGTGDHGGDEVSEFWEYDPQNDEWKQKADFPGEKRQTAVGFSINNKGYIGGGMAGYSDNRTDFWEYDPETDSWSKVDEADFPDDHTAWSTGFASGGNAYFGLGVKFPEFTFSNKFYKKTFSVSTGFGLSDSKSKVRIYPNPARNKLSVITDEQYITRPIEIFDILGTRVLMHDPLIGDEIDISAIKSGTYFIRVTTGNGLFVSQFYKM